MYHFLVKTVTNFHISGQSYRFQEVGAVVSFPKHIGEVVHQKQVAGTEHLVLQSIDPEDEEQKAPEPIDSTPPSDSQKVDPQKVDEEQKEEDKLSPPVEVLPDVPLAANAHWSTVKSFILKMEEEGNLLMVKAIKQKYPNYPAIQEEADRILAAVQ